jgi:hypothetical protein
LGLTLVSAGNLLCAWATRLGGYPAFAIAMAVTGAGAGLLNGDTQKNIMACVPRERTGMASGMSTTMRFSAIMLAIGVYGALLASHTLKSLNLSLQTSAPSWLDQAGYMASRVVAGDMSAALQPLNDSARAMVQPLVGTLMRNPIPTMHLKTA